MLQVSVTTSTTGEGSKPGNYPTKTAEMLII